MLIDSHCHLDFPDFDDDREALLADSRARGVSRMVVLGVYQANWQRVWDLVQNDARLYAAFGLHPVYLDAHQPADLKQLRYGCSVTDACVDWDTTANMLREAAQLLREALPARLTTA